MHLYTPAHLCSVHTRANTACLCPQARSLQAVPRLVKLFNHANQEVQRHATGAMRNLIYDNADNKLALVEENGIFELLRTLREQDDELRKNVTGAPLPRSPAPLCPAVVPFLFCLCARPSCPTSLLGPRDCFVPGLQGPEPCPQGPRPPRDPAGHTPAVPSRACRGGSQCQVGPWERLDASSHRPQKSQRGCWAVPEQGLGPTCPRDPVEPVLQRPPEGPPGPRHAGAAHRPGAEPPLGGRGTTPHAAKCLRGRGLLQCYRLPQVHRARQWAGRGEQVPGRPE